MNSQRVLFVDDEPGVLAAYQTIFRVLDRGLENSYATSGPEALELMRKQSFDVLVSDMNMPGMSGAELLNAVHDQYPATSRLMVSGYADQADISECLSATHQFLAKPFNFHELTRVLEDFRTAADRVEDLRVRELVGRVGNVSSLPQLYFQLIEALDSPNSTINTLAGLIRRDPGMTAKTLQLSNSAFFGESRRTSSLEEATQCLGFSLIRGLVIAHFLFAAFDTGRIAELDLGGIWDHSMATSVIATKIASLESDNPVLIQEAATAGILHDIGKLILADAEPETYGEMCSLVRSGTADPIAAERQAFGATHAEVGACLLGKWGLPRAVIEATAHHHSPQCSQETTFSPLVAVHVASALASADQDGEVPVDVAFLAHLGLEGRLPIWRRETFVAVRRRDR